MHVGFKPADCKLMPSIFNRYMCTPYASWTLSTAGKWKDYPIAITGYGYLFGSLFMGSFTLYYVWTGQLQQFIIPQHVSTHTLTCR